MRELKTLWNALLFSIMCVVIIMIGKQRGTLDDICQSVIDKNRHEALVASLIGSAADNGRFMQTLSPREALMWTMLTREAEENPDATGLQELWTTFSSHGVPVIVNFHDSYGASYTAVIGTVVQLREGGKRFEPALVFYVGNPQGGVVRVEKFDSSTTQYRVYGEWKKLPDADLTLFTMSMKRAIEEHLHLAQSDG